MSHDVMASLWDHILRVICSKLCPVVRYITAMEISASVMQCAGANIMHFILGLFVYWTGAVVFRCAEVLRVLAEVAGQEGRGDGVRVDQ
jgi:hypothetical protein